MIYLFSFQRAVVVMFHRNDRLMRQHRACGIDSLGLGVTYVYIILLHVIIPVPLVYCDKYVECGI